MTIHRNLDLLALAALLSFAPVAMSSCAFGSSSTKPTEEEAQRPEPVPTPPEEQEDEDCANQLLDIHHKLCVDAPPTLPFDHLDRALEAYHKFKDSCPDQMRTSRALRMLEDCMVEIEKAPAVQSDVRDARRNKMRSKAEEIKETDEFAKESRRMKRALETIEDEAAAFEEAVLNGDEKGAKFHGAAWEEAEYQYGKGRKRIEAMMEHVGIDLDDGRALGLW